MPATGIIDRSLVEDALAGFKATFANAFLGATPITDAIATRIQSDSPQETYNWFGEVPKMREWIGDRRFDELRAYAHTIVNKDWANGIRISANDIRDDKLGLVAPKVNALAQAAARHQEELVTNYLVLGSAGTLGLAYDGQFFIDTDHSDGGSASQSNKGTSALDATTYAAGWQSMLERKDENGEPLDIMPKYLIYGPKLRVTVQGLIEAGTLSGGGVNVNYQSVTPILSRRLVGTYDDYWFLIGESAGGMKPIILQEREPVEFIAQDDPESEGYLNRKEFRYGANWRGNAGYGMWQLVYGAIL
jgi:phage major head subunit gpT-like protein